MRLSGGIRRMARTTRYMCFTSPLLLLLLLLLLATALSPPSDGLTDGR